MDIRQKWTGTQTGRKLGEIGVRLEWTGIIFLRHLHILTINDYTLIFSRVSTFPVESCDAIVERLPHGS